MDVIIINNCLKIFSIHLGIIYAYFKIINYNNIPILKILYTILIGIFLYLFQFFTQNYMSEIIQTSIITCIYGFTFSKFTNIKWIYSFIIVIIATSISYICISFSAFITMFIITFFTNFNYTNPIITLLIICIDFIIITTLFKTKRLKNGIPFLIHKKNNDYIDIFILTINSIIIFIYFLIKNYTDISLQLLTTELIVFSILMITVLQKTFILYQKQKLLNKTLKEYETELTEMKFKLETALQEKYNLVKSNHEFYHRQEALKQKLNILLQSNRYTYTSETSEEYSQILDRINTLSKEYLDKTKTSISLPKTNIPELDDMFAYLQSECEKSEIEFIIKINSDIEYMTETLIPKNKLETLIGDLINNAIIAINHSNTEHKSIMVIFGIKDNCYEICVHDSGISFEIPTLLKLGTEPATTHQKDGGTGIGFITTFETLNYCKASLIINENIPNSNIYTKSIIIRFDNCNNYIINSYRYDEFNDFNNFNNSNNSKRIININKMNS